MDMMRSMIRSRVSFILSLLDGRTGQPPASAGVRVWFDGMIRPPLVKPGGLYIFSDLQEGKYQVHIESLIYHDAVAIIDTAALDPKDPVVYVLLMPDPAYSFPSGSTLIRLALSASGGGPAAGAEVRAALVSEYVPKLGKQADPGDGTVSLVNVTGRVSPGDRFRPAGGNADWVVARPAGGPGEYILREPVEASFPRGTLLQPVIATRSNSQGEAVIPVRTSPAPGFGVRVDIVHQGRTLSKDLQLKDGDAASPGQWII